MNPILFNNHGKSPLLQNTVCHFKFNNSIAESTKLITSSITGVGFTYVLGKTGNAVMFNSTYDRIDIDNTSLLSFTDGSNDLPFSISLWAYFTAFSSFGNMLVNKRSNVAGSDEWQVRLRPDKVMFYKVDKNSAGANYQGVIMTNTVSLNQWYHIVVTDNGSKSEAGMKIYVNGVEQSITSFSSGTYTGMALGTHLVRVGQAGWTTGTGNEHSGYIDSLSVWRGRELSGYEVGLLYNSGNGLDYVF